VIPYTWEHTNLRMLEPGGRVNVEGDVIGKYVRRMLPDAT
jgi:riboflavin synthase